MENKATPPFKNDVVIHYPDISQINFIKVDKNYLKVLLINFVIVFILSFLGFFGLTQIEFDDFDLQVYSSIIYLVLAILLSVSLLLLLFEFKVRAYAVREKDISYKKGLLVHKLVTVPYNRIQHLNVTEGFFSRMFDLASLHIFTAGDDSSDLVIKGLPKDRAYQIREYILQETKSL